MRIDLPSSAAGPAAVVLTTMSLSHEIRTYLLLAGTLKVAPPADQDPVFNHAAGVKLTGVNASVKPETTGITSAGPAAMRIDLPSSAAGPAAVVLTTMSLPASPPPFASPRSRRAPDAPGLPLRPAAGRPLGAGAGDDRDHLGRTGRDADRLAVVGRRAGGGGVDDSRHPAQGARLMRPGYLSVRPPVGPSVLSAQQPQGRSGSAATPGSIGLTMGGSA
jgi:hypothetical protein